MINELFVDYSVEVHRAKNGFVVEVVDSKRGGGVSLRKVYVATTIDAVKEIVGATMSYARINALEGDE